MLVVHILSITIRDKVKSIVLLLSTSFHSYYKTPPKWK